MKPKTFIAVANAAGPALSLTEGVEVEISDPAVIADLERAGLVALAKDGMTLDDARKAARARAAEIAKAADAKAAKGKAKAKPAPVETTAAPPVAAETAVPPSYPAPAAAPAVDPASGD